MARRNKWVTGAAVIVVLAMFGSCNNDDSSGTTKNATPIAPKNQDVWVGTVASYPNSYGFSPKINVDLGNGHIESVKLAHIGEPSCGNYSASDAREASMRARIQQLLPIGAQVTIVRGQELNGKNTKFTDEGFVFVDGAAPVTATAPATVTSAPPTTTAVPGTTVTEPGRTTTTTTTNTNTTTLSETSKSTPTTESTVLQKATEILVNETLLLEGLAIPSDPDIDLSAMASKTVEAQMYGGPWPLEVEPNLSHFDRLLSAHRAAWDGSVGFIADCRAEEAKDILQKQQRDELDRIRRGPDGELGTSDDDKQLWKHDENGNLYIDTPSISSGGGGGGGGGRGCRSRWC